MQNPWGYLPHHPPFVLPSDEPALTAFNAENRPEHRLHFDLIPEPFLGRPDAPIVLLNLNPGFDPREIPFHLNDPLFVQLSRNNLLHEPIDYPFYLLDPRISASLGHQWWIRVLKRPILAAGASKVASTFLCVEYFPYHSKRYKALRARTESQRYSFHLVREAIRRGALIVMMRGKSAWLGALPELASYADTYELNSPQNVAISLRNCPVGYPKIARVLDVWTAERFSRTPNNSLEPTRTAGKNGN